jgi:HEAT repeat protein
MKEGTCIRGVSFLAIVLCGPVLLTYGVPSVSLRAEEPRYEGRTFAQWQGDLKDLSPQVREKAAQALASFGPPAIPALLPFVADRAVLRSAFTVLQKAGPSALPLLLPLLKHSDSTVQAEAVVAIARMGPEVPEVVPTLAQVVKDGPGQWVRRQAIQSLGQMGPAAKDAIPVLREALWETDPDIQRGAATALGTIGPTADDAVPLGELMRSDNVKVQLAAAKTLQQLGPAAEPAVGPLTTAFQFGQPEVRIAAAKALGAMGPSAAYAVPELLRYCLAEDVIPRYRDEQTEACNALIATGEEAVPILIGRLVKRRWNGIWLLPKIGAPAVPALAALLTTRDQDVKHQVTETLLAIGAPAVPPLLTAVRNDNKLAQQVHDIIVKMRQAALAPLLEALQVSDRDLMTTIVIVGALSTMGPSAKSAVPELRKIADRYSHSPDPTEQSLGRAANWAIPRIQGK